MQRLLKRHFPDVAHLVRVLHALDAPRDLHELRAERRRDELRPAIRLRAHHRCHRGTVLRVQRGVDLVEQVERHRVAPLDAEDEPDGDDGLLPAAELLHLHRLPRAEGHLDLHAAVLLREPLRGVRLLPARGGGILCAARGRLLALHHELAFSAGNELGENLAEVQRHLLERALDRLVFFLVEVRHELLYFLVPLHQLASSDLQSLALLRELLVLIERFLVHVTELRELLVRLAQQRMQGLERFPAVLLERIRGQRPELANLPLKPFALRLKRRALGHEILHLALVRLETGLVVVLLVQ